MSAAPSMLRRPSAHASRTMPSGYAGSRRWRARLRVLGVWAERRRQRRRLLALSSNPEFLNDVGISRSDAVREAERPFWQE